MASLAQRSNFCDTEEVQAEDITTHFSKSDKKAMISFHLPTRPLVEMHIPRNVIPSSEQSPSVLRSLPPHTSSLISIFSLPPPFCYPVTMVLFVPWPPFPEVVPRSVFVWFLTIAFRLLQHSGLCVDSVWVSCFRCLVAVGVLAFPGGGG